MRTILCYYVSTVLSNNACRSHSVCDLYSGDSFWDTMQWIESNDISKHTVISSITLDYFVTAGILKEYCNKQHINIFEISRVHDNNSMHRATRCWMTYTGTSKGQWFMPTNWACKVSLGWGVSSSTWDEIFYELNQSDCWSVTQQNTSVWLLPTNLK